MARYQHRLQTQRRHARAAIVRSATIVALGGLVLLGGNYANAQFPGGGMPSGGMPGGGMPGGGMPGRGMPGKSGGTGDQPSRGGDEMRLSTSQSLPLASIVQTRLAELRSELAIESSQRPAWDRYSQCVLHLLDDITRVNETTQPSDMTAPQRLEQVADLARNRLTATEDVVDAGKALYAVLTPAQRAVADRRMAEVTMVMFGTRPPGGPSARGDRGRPPASPGGDGAMETRPGPPPGS